MYVALLDERLHVKKNVVTGADVGAVDVRVRHDDNAAVELRRSKSPVSSPVDSSSSGWLASHSSRRHDACAKGRDDVLNLLVAQDLVSMLLDIEDLAARQDRLELRSRRWRTAASRPTMKSSLTDGSFAAIEELPGGPYHRCADRRTSSACFGHFAAC